MHKQKNNTQSSFFVPKVVYFSFFAGVASLLPFLVLYYRQNGLSSSRIGVLAAILPLMMLFGASIWGGLADATRQHNRMLQFAIGGSLLFSFVISLAGTFWTLLLTVFVFAFFFSPIVPLVDNSVMELLGKNSNRYGKIRVWGSIGWGASAPIVGGLAEQSGLNWVFYGYMFFTAILLLVSFRLPASQPNLENKFWQGLRLMLQNREWVLFLIVSFVIGVGISLVNSYLFLYMEDIGASNTLMGLALTAGTVSEVAFFIYADQLLVRWGVRYLLAASLLALGLRLLGYSLVHTPWVVLLVQLLHGPVFALMWVAGVAYAARLAPPGMGATAQGVLSGIAFGLSATAGALVGGLLYDAIGPFMMYRLAAIGVLAALLIFVVAERKTFAEKLKG